MLLFIVFSLTEAHTAAEMGERGVLLIIQEWCGIKGSSGDRKLVTESSVDLGTYG